MVPHATRPHRHLRPRTPPRRSRARGHRGGARGWRQAAAVRADSGREAAAGFNQGGLSDPGSRVRRPHGPGDLRHGTRGEGVPGSHQQVPVHGGVGDVVPDGGRRRVSPGAVQGEGHRFGVWRRGLRGRDARGGVVGRVPHAGEPRPVRGMAVHGRGGLVTDLEIILARGSEFLITTDYD